MSLISFQFLVTLNVYNRFFCFILTENRISAQVKMHQQATESQCCDLFAVHRPNDQNTVGEDGFILLHHLKMVHFKQLHLLLSSTHIIFFGACQMIRSLLCLLMQSQGWAAARVVTGGCWNIRQLPSFCLSLKEMIKGCLLSPSAIPHKSVGKKHLPNEVITDREIQKLIQESIDKGRSTALIAFPEKN